MVYCLFSPSHVVVVGDKEYYADKRFIVYSSLSNKYYAKEYPYNLESNERIAIFNDCQSAHNVLVNHVSEKYHREFFIERWDD